MKLQITSFILQLTVHRFLPFGIMAGLAVAAAIAVMTAPETHNQPTMENLSLDTYKKMKTVNKNIVNTLMARKPP